MNILALSILFSVFYQVPDVIASFDDKDVRNFLGTRTPYRFRYNKNDSRIKYPSKFSYLNTYVPYNSLK